MLEREISVRVMEGNGEDRFTKITPTAAKYAGKSILLQMTRICHGLYVTNANFGCTLIAYQLESIKLHLTMRNIDHQFDP